MPEVSMSDSFSIVEAKGPSKGCSSRRAASSLQMSATLPDAVRDSATAIAEAAWACDFEALVRRGKQGREVFAGPTSGLDTPGAWKEYDACERIARGVIDVLSQGFVVEDGATLELYPKADRSSPLGVEGDVYVWPEDFESEGYVGFRLGIHRDGDWLFFAAEGAPPIEGCGFITN